MWGVMSSEKVAWTCFRWLICEFSGIRFIWRKLWPESDKVLNNEDYVKPSTFSLWTLGIYVGLFGITSTRYELSLDRAESKLSTVVVQLGTSKPKAFKNLLAQIPDIQKIKMPTKPRIFNPLSVVKSLFFEEHNPDILERSKKVIEAWKDDLDEAYLGKANLTKANLSSANFLGAIFLGQSLRTQTYSRLKMRQLDSERLR